jgi:hypothetical protein
MRRAGIVFLLAVFLGLSAGACADGGNERRARPRERPPAQHKVEEPEDVPLPGSPADAAAVLARVERALRSPATQPRDLARLGWEQQTAYRALGAHAEWVPEVLERLPADVQAIVTANERAWRELAELARQGQPPPGLPDWRIAPPLPAEQLRAYYGEAEAASGIPWAYFASIHLVETRLGRIRGTSSAGAQGPMQFLPATWQRYGQGDINDNRDAILAAARLLQANGAPGDMNRALFRYNNSTRYVDAVQSYAQLMLADERAFLGYYEWQVYYSSARGTFLLPEGYPATPARELSRD